MPVDSAGLGMRGGLVTRRMMRSAGVGRTLLVLLGLALVTLLLHPSPMDAGTHAATRHFPQPWALPGSDLVVTITATGYGGLGQVVETFPEGFTYKESSLGSAGKADGQTVVFTLLGDETFTYTVVVPAEEGVYSFSGVLKDFEQSGASDRWPFGVDGQRHSASYTYPGAYAHNYSYSNRYRHDANSYPCTNAWSHASSCDAYSNSDKCTDAYPGPHCAASSSSPSYACVDSCAGDNHDPGVVSAFYP